MKMTRMMIAINQVIILAAVEAGVDPSPALFALFRQRLVCPPQLADDFRYGKVSIKTLPAGGTESTCQCAADLAGNTQSAPAGFGDEDGLNAITGSYR